MTHYQFTADFSKFDHSATAFHGENALFLSDCAKLAYQDATTIRQAITNQLNFKHFKFFSGKQNTQAFIAADENIIITCFRGTQELKDFLTDIKLKPVPGPQGNVHRGFKKGLDDVWGEMLQFISEIRSQNQSLWFCGHSLGAALACLAASEYCFGQQQHECQHVRGIYTIGQPRTGNHSFSSVYNQHLADRSFRIVNNADVVPHLPPPGLIFRYRHINQEIYINRNDKIILGIPWWRKLWDQTRAWISDIGELGFEALEDHGSDLYVQLLKKNRDIRL